MKRNPTTRPAGRDPDAATMRVSLWLYWTVPAAALALWVILAAWQGNQAVFLAVNRLSRYTGDALWANVTVFGNGFVVVGLTLALIGKRPRMILSVLIAALITSVAIGVLKDYFHTPRPPAVLPAGLFHLIGPSLTGKSFPSGHTGTAFVFAGIVSLTFNRLWVTLTLVTLATAVGLSRMVVGVHWPVDVLAGAALGWACAVGAWRLAYRADRWASNPRLQLWLSVPLYAAAFALWWPHLTAYDAARPAQYAVALLAAVGGAAAGPGLIRRSRSARPGAPGD